MRIRSTDSWSPGQTRHGGEEKLFSSWGEMNPSRATCSHFIGWGIIARSNVLWSMQIVNFNIMAFFWILQPNIYPWRKPCWKAVIRLPSQEIPHLPEHLTSNSFSGDGEGIRAIYSNQHDFSNFRLNTGTLANVNSGSVGPNGLTKKQELLVRSAIKYWVERHKHVVR
jgi:hypothetical protein